MATKNIEGIILSRVNFGEADRILTLFTLEEGKTKIIAKGSRKIKSKLASHIEPFSVGNYFVAEGKSFYILAGAEAVNHNEALTSELDLYKDASYVSELLSMTIFEEIPNPKLYQVAKDAYLNLPKYGPEEREIILRYFEYKLLESAGYVPNFRKCVKCGGTLAEEEIYEGDFEGVKCDDCSTGHKQVSKTFVKTIRYFQDNDLAGVLRLKNVSALNQELRDVLLPFLYDILPKTPRARTL
jgi:DNA repair protein RecO (recombination protein O)